MEEKQKERQKKILQRAAKLLKSQEVDDDLLAFYLELIIQRVKNYCNIVEIPEELDLIILQMLVDFWKVSQKEGDGSTSINGVKSVTRGDTRIEYGSSEIGEDFAKGKMATNVIDFVSNYYQQLHAFRKVGTLKCQKQTY